MFLKTVSLPAMAVALSVTLSSIAISVPAAAQDSPKPARKSDDEIVVIAERIRGQVETDQAPIVELNEDDIAAYGADSVADLVAQLSPQTGSGRGRGGQPVFLVNGQRVSSFREFRRYPPEAIRKVEVLPEEVALRFGYPADQRVINFILQDNFTSREIEVEYGGPLAGGSTSAELEASQLRIKGNRRLNLGAEFNTTSILTEAERDVVQSPGSTPDVATDPDPAAYRSLIADSKKYELEGTYNTSLGEGGLGGNFSLNGNFERRDTRSLFGLDTVLLDDGAGNTALRTLDANPLERRTQTTSYSLGSSLNRFIGDWSTSLTLDVVHVDTRTEIDQRRDTSALQSAASGGTLAIDGTLPPVAAAGFDIANNRTTSIDSKLTLIGTPLVLPAGEVSLTFGGELDWKRIESDDTRSNLPLDLDRRRLAGDVNLGIPIAERGAAWGAIGDLSLNFSARVADLSDFGTLANFTAGMTWSPFEPLTLSATYLESEAAPSLTNLGGARITSFNVPVYDFANGTTVLATTISGGNPALPAEKQRDIKLSGILDLGLFENSNLIVEYYRNRSENVTRDFPLLTPAIEAAFPDRVIRDGAGSLVSIDRRPVTFAQTRNDRLRYGFNLFGRLSKAPQSEDKEQAESAEPASGRPGSGAGGGFNSERFAQIRQKFCATPDGETPDISQLPERFQQRLRGEDGKPDPEKIAQARKRFCSGDSAMMNPERFAAIRKAMCDLEEGKEPDIAALPERLQARLRGPDGKIDPQKLAQFRKRICSAPTPSATGGARGGGGGRPGRRGDGRGRWYLSLYHTVEFRNDALIAAGVPQLDLLRGDALGSGGVARHKLQLYGGVFHKGMGLRFSGNYASATTVKGSGLPGSSDLHFGDLATFNLRFFANLEQQKWLIGDNPGFFKGTRMSIGVINIFDAHQRVTDSNGVVPLSYQPALVNPVGRYMEVRFRKMF